MVGCNCAIALAGERVRVDAATYVLTELSGITGDMGQLLDMAMGAK